jgi:hypothetical protein
MQSVSSYFHGSLVSNTSSGGHDDNKPMDARRKMLNGSKSIYID